MRGLLWICAIALLASPLLADEYLHFYDHKVIRAHITNPRFIPMLNKLELDVWTHDSTLVLGYNDIMVNAVQEKMVKLLNIEYEVIIEDVEQHLHEERVTLHKLSSQSLASWFDTYHPLSEIFSFYQSLATSHPTLARFNASIGKSIQSRDIVAISLGKRNATKKIYIEGGQHAREWIGHATVAYITNELITRYVAGEAAAKAILDTIELVVVPVVNPDGYNYTWTTNRLWRKNRRANTGNTFGVDLNRNWNDHWGTVGTSHSPSSDTYCGTAPFSEPETAAVSKFITANGPFALAVDYHSYSQLILRPYGFNKTLPPNDATAKLVGDGIRDVIITSTNVKYTSQPSWALYETSGSAQDWFYGPGKIPLSYTIELRDTGTYGFQLPPAQIIPTGKENYDAFEYYATYVLKH